MTAAELQAVVAFFEAPETIAGQRALFRHALVCRRLVPCRGRVRVPLRLSRGRRRERRPRLRRVRRRASVSRGDPDEPGPPCSRRRRGAVR